MEFQHLLANLPIGPRLVVRQADFHWNPKDDCDRWNSMSTRHSEQRTPSTEL